MLMTLHPSCLVKCAQSLGQMVLQHLESRGAMWPEMYPADAHDAPLLRNIWSLGGPCGRKCAQLMLMMLPSCLVKCAQSLAQMVLQHLESRGAMWLEMYPADAHDAPLLPGKMRVITGADSFATSGV